MESPPHRSESTDTSTLRPEAGRVLGARGAGELGLEKACVAVLFGGTSTERDVSVSSARKMIDALEAKADDSDLRGPARVRPVAIDADGRWRVNERALSPGAALEALSDVDVFVLALHGGQGENGEIQGFLRVAEKRFAGSAVLATALAMDKELSRRLFAARGLHVARGAVIARDGSAGWLRDRESHLARLNAWEVGGWVIKPREGGSSVGTSVVRERSAIGAAIDTAFEFDREVLVEAFVGGVEVAAGVLCTPDRGIEALPLVEIRPHAGRFFDYEEKYSSTGAEEFCPPERVSAAVCDQVREMALLAHETLRCEGYSRTDFIVPDDGTPPVILELNTLPGMTPRSLFPQAARVAGVDYRTLCLWLAAEALARR